MVLQSIGRGDTPTNAMGKGSALRLPVVSTRTDAPYHADQSTETRAHIYECTARLSIVFTALGFSKFIDVHGTC